MGEKIPPKFTFDEDENEDVRKKKLSDLSFEEIVERGELKREGEVEKVSVRLIPTIICASVFYLRKKDERIKTQASVQLYGTALGISCIQTHPGIKDIEAVKKTGVESGSLSDLLSHFAPHHYDWAPPLNLYSPRGGIMVARWVGGAITDLGAILGLTKPMMTMLALMAGLARSNQWLSPGLRDPLVVEAERFKRWIDGIAK